MRVAFSPNACVGESGGERDAARHAKSKGNERGGVAARRCASLIHSREKNPNQIWIMRLWAKRDDTMY